MWISVYVDNNRFVIFLNYHSCSLYYHKLYQTEQHQSCFQESIWLQVDADLDPVCKATILKATRLQVHCKHPWSFWSLWQEWWIWPHSSHTYTLFGMPYLWTPVTHTPQQQPPQVLTRLIQEMGDVPMQLQCVNLPFSRATNHAPPVFSHCFP